MREREKSKVCEIVRDNKEIKGESERERNIEGRGCFRKRKQLKLSKYQNVNHETRDS